MRNLALWVIAMCWMGCSALSAYAGTPSAFPGKAAAQPGRGLTGNEIGDIVYSGAHLWVAAGSSVCKLEGSGEQAADWTNYDFGPQIAGEAPSAFCAYGDTLWVATGYRTTYQGEEIPAGNGLYRSLDGGETWRHFATQDLLRDRVGAAYPDNYTTCYDIVHDGGTLWASFTAGFLVKTSDLGNTWQQILPNTDTFDFSNPNHHGQCVIAYGDTIWVGTFGGIMQSVDGGATWINHPASPEGLSGSFVPALGRQVFRGRSVVWAGTVPFNPGEGSGVSLTRDSGETWEHINIPARTEPALGDTAAVTAWNFAFGAEAAGRDVSDSTVWAATDEALFQSNDMGRTWRKLEVEDRLTGEKSDAQILYVAFAEGVLWAATDRGLARSADYGETWRILESPVRTLSLDEGTFVSGIGEATEPIRTYAYLNPFSPSRHEATRIRYSLSAPARVTVKVYDFAGVLVATLVDGAAREGGMNHAERWDGRDGKGRQVANGTYFYRIETDGGHRAFGKIVVLD